MQARRAIVAFVALGAASSARPAGAAEPDSPVVASLAVTGPPDCAGRAEVVKLIARRSARIRLSDGAAAGPELRVVVDAAAARAVSASLSIAWPNGSRSERHLTAPTCGETADAVALVIVLALDPAAAEREAPAPPPPRAASPPPRTETASPPRASSPPPRAETAAPPRERPTAEPAAEKPAPPPPPPASTDEPPPRPPPPPDPTPPVAETTVVTRPAPVEPSPPPVYRFDAGAAARIVHGPAPQLMPGVAVAAGWERDTSSIWSLKLQLIAAHHQRGGWTTFYGTADFALDVVTLHVCPLRVGPRAVHARLCASSTAGRLAVESRDNLTPRTASRPFLGVGGAALLAAMPHPRVEVSASVEPQAALLRDTFGFGSNVIYEVPAVALFFGLGASVTFP
jgi:hypothetical protein